MGRRLTKRLAVRISPSMLDSFLGDPGLECNSQGRPIHLWFIKLPHTFGAQARIDYIDPFTLVMAP